MSDIKFINEYYELLINKIDESNNRINGFVDDISNELKDCVSQFTENISGKLKIIEYKFNRQSDELDRIKKELEAKKFDEKNFMNVSITMNQAKQIKERDLKIKELEQRIKFIEGKHAASLIVSSNAPSKVELLAKPLEVIQEEEVVSNSVEEPAIQVAAVVPIAPATKPKRAAAKKKIEIKKGKAIEEEPVEIPVVVVEPVEIPVVVIEPVEIPVVVEETSVVEKPKVKGKAKKPTKAEEAKRLADAKLAEAEAALAIEEEVIVSVVEEISIEEVLPAVEVVVEVKNTKTEEKANNNISVKYPDIIPNLSDVEVLEYNDNVYYIDTLNNVFQMTADEEIGLFMGIYDKDNNNIIMMS